MSLSSWLFWLVILAVYAWCIYWHTKENNALIKNWQDAHGKHEGSLLSRFAWARSFQLFAALCALLIAVLVYSWRIDTLKDQVEYLRTVSSQAEKPTGYPPIVMPQQAVQQRKTPTSNPVAELEKTPPPPVVDLFTPSTSANDHPSIVDNLKQQYENSLVLYFIMSRCNFILPTDYDWIMASLRQDMEKADAPAELQEQILNAAKGSYQELYAYNKCESPEIQELASQFRTYINSLYQLNGTK